MKNNKLFKTFLLERGLIYSGIVAPVVLAIAVIIAGALHPGYSHIYQPISLLGAPGSPFRAILNYGGLIPAGILTVIFSLAMFRHLKGSAMFSISSALVTVVGVGRMVAGFFPCDPDYTNLTSLSARIHFAAAMVSLLAGAIAPLVMALGLRSRQPRRHFWVSLGLGTGALLMLAISPVAARMQWIGISQRLLLFFTYAWIIAVAIKLNAAVK